jgi:hypothetical protein
MPEDRTSDDTMMLILSELKSLNRTMRLLAGHFMDLADLEAPPRQAGDGMIHFTSNELPQRLAEPIMVRLREMEPRRREHLLGELRRAWDGS